MRKFIKNKLFYIQFRLAILKVHFESINIGLKAKFASQVSISMAPIAKRIVIFIIIFFIAEHLNVDNILQNLLIAEYEMKINFVFKNKAAK